LFIAHISYRPRTSSVGPLPHEFSPRNHWRYCSSLTFSIHSTTLPSRFS
jgi:hypothetical protein